jgi:hypothetical protein
MLRPLSGPVQQHEVFGVVRRAFHDGCEKLRLELDAKQSPKRVQVHHVTTFKSGDDHSGVWFDNSTLTRMAVPRPHSKIAATSATLTPAASPPRPETTAPVLPARSNTPAGPSR